MDVAEGKSAVVAFTPPLHHRLLRPLRLCGGTAGREPKLAQTKKDNLCVNMRKKILIAANETFLHLHTHFLAYRCEELILLTRIIFAYHQKNMDASSLWRCLCLPKSAILASRAYTLTERWSQSSEEATHYSLMC